MSSPVKFMAILLLCGLACGCRSPEPPLEVTIVHVQPRGSNDAHLYLFQEPYTVIEETVSRKRRLVPGVLGKIGDEFRLGTMPIEMP